MTDGTTWLAAPRAITFGGHHVVLARGLTPEELADRLAATVLYDAEHIAVPVGEHTTRSLLELMEDTYGDPADGIGLRLGRAGDWTYAVACTAAGRVSSAPWDQPRAVTRTSASWSTRRRTANRSRRSSRTSMTAAC